MHYRTKLLFSHALIVLMLIIVFISLFRYYYILEQERKAMKNLQSACEKMLG
jgi:preprotein translocase subunit YajC